jgi:hypothetical protein
MPKVSFALRALKTVFTLTGVFIAATFASLFTHDAFLSKTATAAKTRARSDHRRRAAVMPLSLAC